MTKKRICIYKYKFACMHFIVICVIFTKSGIFVDYCSQFVYLKQKHMGTRVKVGGDNTDVEI